MESIIELESIYKISRQLNRSKQTSHKGSHQGPGRFIYRGPILDDLMDNLRQDTSSEPLAPSTNSVHRVLYQEQKFILKIYKNISKNVSNENWTQFHRAMLNKKNMGAYYQHSDNKVLPLFLMMPALAGQSWDRELSTKIRQYWTNPEVIFSVILNVRHLAKDLFDFHEELKRELNTAEKDDQRNLKKTFSLKDLKLQLRNDWQVCLDVYSKAQAQAQAQAQSLSPSLLQSQFESLFPSLWQRMEMLLEQCKKEYICPQFGHGDLHLSHVFFNGGRFEFIDVSLPFLSTDHPQFSIQSPYADLASLIRSLEYFTFDEGEYQLSTNASSDITTNITSDKSFFWVDTLSQELIQSYWQCQPISNRFSAPFAAIELFYWKRWLYEFKYNLDHSRFYFQDLDLFFLKYRLDQGFKWQG